MSGNAHQRRQARRHPHDRRVQPSAPVLNGKRETDPVEMLFDGGVVSGYPERREPGGARETFERKVKRSERRRNLLLFAVVATLGAIVYLAIWAG